MFFHSTPVTWLLAPVYRFAELPARFCVGVAATALGLPLLLPRPETPATWIAAVFFAAACGTATATALRLLRAVLPAWARWHRLALAHRHHVLSEDRR